MRRLIPVIIFYFSMASAVSASQRVDNRVQFSSYMGYIVEKMVVPAGKNCMTSMETQAMDESGVVAIAIAEIPETQTADPEILFQTYDWFEGDSGKREIALENTPVYPGQEIMVNCVYMIDDYRPFSVPVQPGGIELGHNEIDNPFAEPPEPISEPGYSAFTIGYGCETEECINTAPQFTKGDDITAQAGKTYAIGNWAADILPGLSDCEAEQTLHFILTPDEEGYFLQSPRIDPATGDLAFETAPDIEGTATVTVILKDDGGTENSGTDSSVSKNFSITILIPGNIDGVNGVTLADAVLAAKVLANLQTSAPVTDAEVNGDGRIGPEELIYILRTVSEVR